jgi:hypothetical protein
MPAGEAFQSIRGSICNTGIVIPKTLDKLFDLPGVKPDAIDNFIDQSDGKAVAPNAEHGMNRLRPQL